MKQDIANLDAILSTPAIELLPATFFERKKELQEIPLYELVEELFSIFFKLPELQLNKDYFIYKGVLL